MRARGCIVRWDWAWQLNKGRFFIGKGKLEKMLTSGVIKCSFQVTLHVQMQCEFKAAD